MKKIIAVAILVLASVAGSGCTYVRLGPACHQVIGHPLVCSK
jgi:hypothetical protein